MTMLENQEALLRQGTVRLLEVKDSDIRISALQQCRDAVDKTIHAGGAFSAIIPLVSLFYGGFIDLDVENPTRRGQDMFILSKGHAIAAIASIYADLGYFDRAALKGSRSLCSIVKGHPGPALPGVPISTGPLGQGLSVAQGLALIGQRAPHFDVFCMTGDGELHEGTIWESVMYAGHKKLDNLCVLVDKNRGQLDDTHQLLLPVDRVGEMFRAFGWRVVDVDATQYGPVVEALREWKYAPRDGRPTAIVCHTVKGFGGFSDAINQHKAVLSDPLVAQELALHAAQRAQRAVEFLDVLNRLGEGAARDRLIDMARDMHLDVVLEGERAAQVMSIPAPVKARKAPPRDKRIAYNPDELPRLDPSRQYATSDVITEAMKVLARDPRVVSIDADLASTSGLQAGIAHVDVGRALNVGVAEANMMGIGEAFALMGYNAWVSTFCPFFEWRVLRRIAIGYQERLESMEGEGWLNEGHGLDLTFVATAPNFETKTNGATHMGNDDITLFDAIAHLKIIDVSCPQQMLGVTRWIVEGNRGLVYVRIMRAPSPVLYGPDFEFHYGRGYPLRQSAQDRATIVSSGRGVHEALHVAAALDKAGVRVGVVDMPSIDERLLLDLYDAGKPVVIAEQNNGFIYRHCLQTLFRNRRHVDTSRIVAVNTLDDEGRPRFLHSGTYEELMDACGLAPAQLAAAIQALIETDRI